MSKIGSTHFIYRLNIVLFTIVIAGLCLFGIEQILQNKNFTNTIALATTVKPETFTELYFQNHLNLPSQVIPNKQYSFTFTIHNIENQDMKYPYEVYILQQDGSKAYIDHNTVSIANNNSLTIQESFLLTDQIGKSEIIVNLTQKNQEIDFWINE